ncbi:hypothetical protein GJ496_002157 [Pomphorhynchus laevis]|nr:hypothetical protein GJ496_002157 [Pomphorhynchus laevis]
MLWAGAAIKNVAESAMLSVLYGDRGFIKLVYLSANRHLTGRYEENCHNTRKNNDKNRSTKRAILYFY